MTNAPAPDVSQPATPTEPPRRLPRMAVPWTCLALFAVMVGLEFAIVATWEVHDCNIGAAMLAFLGIWITAALVPITTLVQQLRSPRGYRRVGQAVTLYVLSVLVLFPISVIAMMPLLFADSC